MDKINQFQAAVIGGDARQIIVAEAIAGLFAKVKIFGHPPADIPEGIEGCSDLATTITGTRVIILPIGGMNEAGLVRSYQADRMYNFGVFFPSIPEGTLLLAGSLTATWLQKAAAQKIKVYEYGEDDEIAILNSIPTAEGALQIAMEELPITIHGSTVLVAGFGRVGITVARMFKALGARVIVAARKRIVLARAKEMGCETVGFPDPDQSLETGKTEFINKDLCMDHHSLASLIGSCEIIINTIPALVFSGPLLMRVSATSLIIDLASPPGGTDFKAAKELNIKAILAPGLPGKVALKTSGAILASTIPLIISKILNDGGGEFV